MKDRFILASGSPRRREILRLIGFDFDIIKSGREEDAGGGVPEEMVTNLADMKSRDVAARLISREIPYRFDGAGDVYVIGADTMVFYGGMALGKPKDEKDAEFMLSMLSGKTHQVSTGVSILRLAGEGGDVMRISGSRLFAETTLVSVADMDKEEILSYIATGDYRDKAGSYGIQGLFSRYVERIDGDYFNVVGFPACRFYTELKSLMAKK